MPVDDEIQAAFDDIFLLEDRLLESGYQEGVVLGIEKGWKEGYNLGYLNGLVTGTEIHFCEGVMKALSIIGETEVPRNLRTQRVLDSISSMTRQFPHNNADHLGRSLEEIRSKFKQVCSLLKMDISSGTTGLTF